MAEPSKYPLFYQWWRWPLVPLAAITGALAGSILIALLYWLSMKLQGGYSEDGWMYRYILPTITSAVFGLLYVKISYDVAPKGKLITGVVMTTLLFLFSVLNIWLAWYLERYSPAQSIQITVGSIASFITAVISLIQIHAEAL